MEKDKSGEFQKPPVPSEDFSLYEGIESEAKKLGFRSYREKITDLRNYLNITASKDGAEIMMVDLVRSIPMDDNRFKFLIQKIDGLEFLSNPKRCKILNKDTAIIFLNNLIENGNPEVRKRIEQAKKYASQSSRPNTMSNPGELVGGKQETSITPHIIPDDSEKK